MGILYTCNYQFSGLLGAWNKNLGNAPKGGRLTAANPLWTSSAGNQVSSPPTLNGSTGGVPNGDRIQAMVTFSGAGMPSGKVKAVFTFTPAVDANAQTLPIGASPFLAGGTFVCSQPFTGALQSGGSATQATYAFGPTAVYNGSLMGSYELTIVITDANGTQWSIDPEFETGS